MVRIVHAKPLKYRSFLAVYKVFVTFLAKKDCLTICPNPYTKLGSRIMTRKMPIVPQGVKAIA